jgi:G3E family GTPase
MRIKDFRRGINPDYLFIEPSEMVVTRELRDTAAMGLRDVRFEVGPLITLVDGPTFDNAWEERRALVHGQITGADIVAVSRCDLVDDLQLERIAGLLIPYGDGLLNLSTLERFGLKEVMEKIDRSVV